MSNSKLVPIEQKEVGFYGDAIIAVRLENGEVMVPIRPICDALGLDWSGQRQRIGRDEILSEVARGVVVTPSPPPVDMSGEGITPPPQKTNKFANPQEMTALPLRYLNGWLFGISAKRVKPEVKDRLLSYQRDCYNILNEAFQLQRVTAASDELIAEMLKTDSPAAQAYKMVIAMAQMARQQLIHEAGINTNATNIAANTNRISLIEAQLGDKDRFIDTKQASRISQAVKAIGLEMGKRSGRNEFGGVYGELYRRFEIAGYRELPAARFDEAFNFLSDWYSSLTNSELPF